MQQIAHKARAAGLASPIGTIVLWILARFTGAVEPPTEAMFQEALGLIGVSMANGAAAAQSAYQVRNRAKPGVDTGR